MVKNIFSAIVIIFLCFLIQKPLFASADNCSDRYPQGKGSGVCMNKSECKTSNATDAQGQQINDAVSIITGLCPGGADNICCVFTSEINSTGADSNSGSSSCNPNDKSKVCLQNPLSGSTDVPGMINKIIKGLLGIIGAISLLMFVWGGSTWLLSAGNQEKVKAGTQTMIWAALGVLIVFMSYLFLSSFTKFLSGG